MSTTTTTTTTTTITPTSPRTPFTSISKPSKPYKPSPLSQSFTPDDLAETPITEPIHRKLTPISAHALIALSTAHTTVGSTPTSDPTMTVAHTYFLAHLARDKLSRVVAHPQRNLRLLVGHANLLDTLFAEITANNAAYNAISRHDDEDGHPLAAAAAAAALARPAAHVRWGNAVVMAEYDDDDDGDFGMDSSSDEDEDDYDYVYSDDDDEEEDDEEEDLSQLELVRTSSRSAPPELALDDDDEADSEDEAVMPPSPPQAAIDIYRGEGADEADEKPLFEVPPRSPARVIAGTGF